MITVIFTVTSVNDGCDFASVVGSIPELGAWDPTKGVRATGPLNAQYAVTVNLPEGLDKIEFKWIFWHGEHFIWEAGLNKVIYDLPKKSGSVCQITNELNGPARKVREIVPPNRYNIQGLSRVNADMVRRRVECISRFLKPRNWSRRGLGLGLTLLLPICLAIILQMNPISESCL